MRRIQIYDTTLRDGSQGEGVNFSLQDKLLITERLDSLGFDFVEGGFPASNEKDAQYFQRAAGMKLAYAKVCAFGMTRRRGTRVEEDPGIRALLNAGTEVITLVGKTSSFHVTEVLRVSLEENLAMIADSVRHLSEAGRKVIYDAEHFFDGWKLNPEYALSTVRAAAQAGAIMVVMCDTNGGTMPEEIAALTREAIAGLDVPVGIHCHNDCELAVANSLASLDAGAVQVQGTINGLGERCGNADLISIIANLAVKKQGYSVLEPSAIEHLTELSRFVYETANFRLPANQPFVGQSAFAHKGGMHVHAVERASASYEHIDPSLVGNERRVLVSELSGRSNIKAALSGHDIAQDPGMMDKILARVVELENQGYQFEAAQGSFDLLVRKSTASYRPHFERLHFRVNVETDSAGNVVTEATVKLRVDGVIRHEVAEGDGPVNALDAALRKALAAHFPNLEEMQLVDYKVRVINSEAGTAAGVRVVIESRDQNEVWGTVGVSENIIEASWIALVDSFEYKLYKDEDAATAPLKTTPVSVGT
ncbi:MAG TPA: citramalate synthase [Pirellulales bacterium]|jgi:2-isopropylmalate synthase|nr:citramalate synthase [Pirellulales bacterium]